jgi:hypothetical protein
MGHAELIAKKKVLEGRVGERKSTIRHWTVKNLIYAWHVHVLVF